METKSIDYHNTSLSNLEKAAGQPAMNAVCQILCAIAYAILALKEKIKETFEENIQEIKVVSETDAKDFADEVQKYLNQGFKVASSNCGFVNSKEYDFCDSFQAILIKEGKA